jgi:hypothetical protein
MEDIDAVGADPVLQLGGRQVMTKARVIRPKMHRTGHDRIGHNCLIIQKYLKPALVMTQW